MSAPPLLSVRALSRSFGASLAVDGVTLGVEAGQIVGLVGPNGAGKTTTLRILATLDYPTSGDVRVLGLDPTTEPERVRPLIGYMPESFGLDDSLQVREYLDTYARLAAAASRRRLLDDTLELTDLGGLASTPIGELSRGVRQRVFIARTLLSGPRLLLLDEPSTGLDPRARTDLGALLEELARMGKGILISSHILSELEEVIDGLVVLERGKVVHSGPYSPQVADSGSFRVEVWSLSDSSSTVADLERRAGVESIRVGSDGRVSFVFRGQRQALVDLHRELVAADRAMLSFHVRPRSLEDVYFAVTTGEIQ
jgi:ABC-2 type transport system ATP-binding protein